MPIGSKRTPKPGKSRQKKHGGGSFESENQRRFLWARYPQAAKKWAHNRHTTKSDWMRSSAGIGAHSGMRGSHGMGPDIRRTARKKTSRGKGKLK
jgi:hypothetical protein